MWLIFACMYIYISIHMYVYIYIEREREREILCYIPRSGPSGSTLEMASGCRARTAQTFEHVHRCVCYCLFVLF